MRPGVGAWREQVEAVRAQFAARAKADGGGAGGLGLASFKLLVLELMSERGDLALPTDKDLGVAFKLADEDKYVPGGGSVSQGQRV